MSTSAIFHLMDLVGENRDGEAADHWSGQAISHNHSERGHRLTGQGLQNLYDRIERMRGLGPEFIDITW